MNVYITNVTENIDISIREKTLKPGSGSVFSEEVSKQDGVVAYTKKGWLKVEMVKESPEGEGVAAGIVPEPYPMTPTEAASSDTASTEGKKKKRPIVHNQ